MSRRALLTVLGTMLLLSTITVGVVADSAPQTTAEPYYGNESTQVDNESWMDNREEPTLDNATHMVTRVGSFVIGEQQAQGGGWAGILITAIVALGVMLGATVGANLGAISGATLSVVSIRALVAAGLAPAWIMAVALMLLGLAVSGVLIRPFR